jgi:predicted nucleic acid-binding protein
MATVTLEVLGRGYEISDTVYLDANFLISAYAESHDLHDRAALLLLSLMAAAAQRKVRVLCSPLVVDECLWGITAALYQRESGRQWGAAPKREKDAALRRHRTEQERFVRTIQHQSWLEFVPVQGAHVGPAFDEMKRHNIRPRDAFHMAVAKANNAGCIVTSDRDLRDALERDPDIAGFNFATIHLQGAAPS